MQRIEKLELTTPYPIGAANSYVVFSEKLTLIDAGLNNNQGWKDLNNGLQDLGIDVCDLEQLVLTHHHDDHTGLVDRILEMNPSIKIFAYKDTEMILKDERYFQWGLEFFYNLFREFGMTEELASKWSSRKDRRDYFRNANVDVVLEEGDQIPGFTSFEVIETKGHSQDHISFYNAEEEVFICGDHIIKGIHVGMFLNPPKMGKERAKPLIQYLLNLEKCRKLPAKMTYSGHGPNIDNLNKAIDEHINNIEKRVNRVITTLIKIDGAATGFEIIQEMYRGRNQNQIIAYLLEILGVLDLLEERKMIIAEKEQGVVKYRLVK